MSESEQDRWRELADLLGLPPDDPGEARSERRETKTEDKPPAEKKTHGRDESEASVPTFAQPPEQFGAPVFEETIVTEMTIHEEDYREPTASAPHRALADKTEEADDRPRRGRRRGRRGSRNDRFERDERAPDDATDVAQEPAADDGLAMEPLERPDADSSLNGGGADDEMGLGDDIAEPEEVETIESAVDEGDEEEVDHLKDWNVPSWTELIGSLYRPER